MSCSPTRQYSEHRPEFVEGLTAQYVCFRVNQAQGTSFGYSLLVHSSDLLVAARSPRGITAIGIFLEFGAVMASLAGTTLVWPGTSLDRVWVLNRGAYHQLAPFGRAVGVMFLLLAMVLAVAGIGWLKRRRWGWRLAVVIIATQVLGDFVNALRGHVAQGATGVTIAGALFLYMTRRHVRAAFKGSSETD